MNTADTALVSPEQVQQMLGVDDPVLLDTRDPEVYKAGHLPGAVNVRDVFTYLATSDAEGISSLVDTFARLFGEAGLDGARPAVLYEDAMDSGYGQSCRGFFLLKLLGYPRVHVLHGGYQAWVAAGLPVSTEETTATPANFPLKLNADLMVTKDQVLAALGNPAVTLLDCRDADEWLGLSSSPYGVDFCPRKGRLPGAVWLEWYTLMESGPAGIAMFKSPEEIAELAGRVGVTPETDTIIYCFKGARASNTFLALAQAGITRTRIYFGSWNEWSRDAELPIEEGPPDPARPAVGLSGIAGG
jgi:thiosulfate/3-mercaptopyruvate sulfurtransferase